MAQTVYRGNLSAQTFPLRSDIQAQTVMVARNDGTAFTQEQYQRDSGVPQVMYCHNVMPTLRGYQSVSYRQKYEAYPSPLDVEQYVRSVLTFPDGSGTLVHLVVDQEDAYTTEESINPDPPGGVSTSSWRKRINQFPGHFNFGTPEVAYVNGVAYFGPFGGADRWYTFDGGTDSFVPVTFTGLAIASGAGILSTNGVMVVWDDVAIGWSSNVDPTDFTPSLATGAGGGNVQEIKGRIVNCVGVSWGFIIFGNFNAVAAIYTGNLRYPYTFKEIQNCGGLIGSIANKMATKYQKDDVCYAFTTRGFQQISQKEAKMVNADMNDFFSGKVLEDYNRADGFPSQQIYTTGIQGLDRAVAMIADRYLCVSYGVNFTGDGDEFNPTKSWEYSHVLVWDTALNRWGKLRHAHADLFEMETRDTTDEGSDAPDRNRNSMAFLRWNGVVDLLDFTFDDIEENDGNSILILGRYQVERGNVCTLEEVQFENVDPATDMRVFDGYTLDGRNVVEYKEGYDLLPGATGYTRRYAFHQPGVNHAVIVSGRFNLTDIILTMKAQAGRR